MTLSELKAAYNAKPFRPFILHVADGSQVPVPSPEFLAPPPDGRTMVVYKPEGGMHILDLLLVTHLEFKAAGDGSGRRRRG